MIVELDAWPRLSRPGDLPRDRMMIAGERDRVNNKLAARAGPSTGPATTDVVKSVVSEGGRPFPP